MELEICGNGFLGTYARDYFKKFSNYRPYFSSKGFQYHSENSSFNHAKPKIVLNLSGPSSVEESMTRRDYYRDEPLRQVKFQLEYLSNILNPPHYVFISSAAVYGNCKHPYPDEYAPLNPLSPYAEGKAAAEDFLLSQGRQYMGGITILRATSIFAENLSTRVLGRIKSCLTNGVDFELFGSGKEIRDFLHASDFCNLTSAVIQKGVELKGVHIYNIASGNPITMNQLIELAIHSNLKQTQNLKVKFNGVIRAGDPHTIAVSTQKIMKLTDVKLSDPTSRLRDFFSIG